MTSSERKPRSGLTEAKATLLRRWQERRMEQERPPEIPRRARGEEPARLSFAQERIWFVEQLQPGTPVHNLCFCAAVEGHLDPAILSAAADTFVARHETLRCCVRLEARGPCQVPAATAPRLEIVDLRERPVGAQREEALDVVAEAARTAMDLERGPLARMILCTTSGARDVLAIIVHHLAADGWSLGVALRELGILYAAARDRRAPALSRQPIAYGDFAEWQRAHIEKSGGTRDLAYWRRELKGVVPLELPLDRPRPSVLPFDGDWCEIRIPREESEALRRMARMHGATTFMALTAVIQALLHHWSSQRDITVGSPIAGRDRRETLEVVGNFINMLTLRSRVEGDPTFADHLAKVRAATTQAMAHSDLPFEKLVEDLALSRERSRAPLFQVLLVLQPPVSIGDFAGLPLERVEVGNGAVRADLEFHLWDHEEIAGRLEFSAALFDRATIERWIHRLLVVIRRVAASPDIRLSDCLPVEEDEARAVLALGRGTALEIPGASLHALVERQVDRIPSAIALTFGRERLSYRALDERANRLAHALMARGVRPGVRVGVALERGVDMVATLLAVLKTGAAYVPLDPRQPPVRLARIAAEAQLAAIVSVGGDAIGAGENLARLDPVAAKDEIAARPTTRIAYRGAPDDVAYVMFTSGSTGRPKGVLVSHRSVVNALASMSRTPGIGEGDVLLATTTIVFDISVLELFLPLLAGASIVLASDEDVLDPERIHARILDECVTVLQATPSVWSHFLSSRRLRLDGVKALCGGEAMPDHLARALVDRGCRSVWNMYGPTETTIWSTAGLVEPGARVALGRPLENTELAIVDDRMRLVPLGVAGELCIGGNGVALGYLGQPAVTAGRFVPDPFSSRPGARMYRTGDLARWRSDGTLEFLGRDDEQVKLRGNRLELGEIEAALVTHPAVARAAASVARSTQGDARLVVHAVLREDPSASADSRRSFSGSERSRGPAGSTDAPDDPRCDGLGRILEALDPRAIALIGAPSSALPPAILRRCDAVYVVDDPEACSRAVEGLLAEVRPRVTLLATDRTSGPLPVPAERVDVAIVDAAAHWVSDSTALEALVRSALAMVKEPGAVIVSDVRALSAAVGAALTRLLEWSGDLARRHARSRVTSMVRRQPSLAVHPSTFQRIAATESSVTALELRALRGLGRSTGDRERYDVVLHRGRARASAPETEVVELDLRGHDAPLRLVDEQLASRRPRILVARGLPLWPHAEVRRLRAFLSDDWSDLGELRRALGDVAPTTGADPAAFSSLPSAAGFDVHFRWGSEDQGDYDVVFERLGEPRAIVSDAVSAPPPPPVPEPEPWRSAWEEDVRKELVAHLRTTLPAPLIPASIAFLDELPMTDNGKIARRALPPMDSFAPATATDDAPPETPTEQALAVLEAEILGVPRVGRNDDFFALGGHSLLLARLIAAVRDRYGVQIDIREVFASPTLENLARAVDEGLRKDAFLRRDGDRLRMQVEGLSPEAVDRLLATRLRRDGRTTPARKAVNSDG